MSFDYNYFSTISFCILLHVNLFSLFRGSSAFRASLWESRDDFSDLVIVVGKGNEKAEFRGHKIVFAASSNFFRQKLKTLNLIALPEVTKEDFSSIFEFVYKGQMVIREQDRQRLVEVAKKLEIEIEEIESELEPSCSKKRKFDRCLKEEKEDPLNPTSDVGEEQKKVACQTLRELPTEILMKIFIHMSTSDLLTNVARVSKRFYEIALDPRVHRVVSINMNWIISPAIKFLEKSNHITELHAKRKLFVGSGSRFLDEYRASTIDCLLLAAGQHSTLRVINFSPNFYYVSMNALEKLEKFECWKNLRSISCKIKDENDFYRPDQRKLIQAPPKLRHLGFNPEASLFSRFILHVPFKDLVSLKNLIITEVEKFNSIIDESRTTLKELEIQSVLETIPFHRITECRQLTHLGIICKSFNSFEILKDLVSLKALKISMTPKMFQNLKKLDNQKLGLESLTLLTTGKTQLSQVQLQKQGIYCPFALDCPNLRNVSIRNEDFQSQNLARAIVTPFIKNCPELETITVERLEDDGEFLPDITLHLPRLRLLAILKENVSNCLARHIFQQTKFSAERPIFAIMTKDVVFVNDDSAIPSVRSMIDEQFQDGILIPKFRNVNDKTRSEDFLKT
jgi:hypothetical protein